MNYNISKLGKAEILLHEGICQTKYKDSVGVWTIGAGATSSEIPDLASWPTDKSLSLSEIFDLFNKGLQKYVRGVNLALKVPVEQYQFDALVSICYNIGIAGTRGSTFMRKINSGASMDEIRKSIMMWTRQKELVGRRSQEAELYMFGKYHNTSMRTTLFPVNSRYQPVYPKGQLISVEAFL